MLENNVFPLSKVIDSGLLDTITSEEKKLQEAMFEVYLKKQLIFCTFFPHIFLQV